MHGELQLEKDLAELSVPQLLARLNELAAADDSDVNEEDAEQDSVPAVNGSDAEDSVSEDEPMIDEADVRGLHAFFLRRSERLQQVYDDMEPLEQALRDFKKGYEVFRHVSTDDIDVDDDQDEDYRPNRRQLRRVDVPTPLWQRQPEIAALFQRRIARIKRLQARCPRLSDKVQQARARWRAALATRQRMEERERQLKEARSQLQKKQEHEWLQALKEQARERAHKAATERFAAAQRKAKEEDAEREQEKVWKREALAQHVQAFEEQERLLRARQENRAHIRSYRDALQNGNEPAFLTSTNVRTDARGRVPQVTKQTLQVMLVLCEAREAEYAAKVPKPTQVHDARGPSIHKHAHDRSIEQGDLEFEFRR